MNGLGHLCNLHWAVTGVTRKGWDTGRGNPFDDLLSCLVGVTRCRLGPAQSPLSWAGDTLCSSPLADIPDIIFIHHMKIDIYATNNNKILQCTSSSSKNLFLRCKRWISSPTRVGGCCCCFPHQQTNNTAHFWKVKLILLSIPLSVFSTVSVESHLESWITYRMSSQVQNTSCALP